jgi:hypothetical protein
MTMTKFANWHAQILTEKHKSYEETQGGRKKEKGEVKGRE